ncbi:TetR/AcrR family transcriptional regulator [Microbacterium sp. Leaf179]|uniref:TetR/AcrR family transcriptional regulator n=1 Tax=Microbacterium sp. Leaf179 TaxID=1736288 RepID=UPI0006F98D4A|nr:TetR/AcrR family transcriptional regulator [Microbacterium sp. Leaf179]KQR89005.1 TetR family transcriptional regulator [Microbacterium sp. Leaf179]
MTTDADDAGATIRGPRGPYASTPARKAEIVRAASASFAEHGFERASLRDIASRAGLTHAALLRHFATKDELLLEALRQRDADDIALAERILASEHSPEQVLSSVFAEEFAHPEEQRNWLAITIAATDPGHPAHDFFVQRRDRVRGYFSTTRLAAAGDGEEVTADEKITLVLAMIDGLRIQSLLDPGRRALPLLDVFLRLIASP